MRPGAQRAAGREPLASRASRRIERGEPDEIVGGFRGGGGGSQIWKCGLALCPIGAGARDMQNIDQGAFLIDLIKDDVSIKGQKACVAPVHRPAEWTDRERCDGPRLEFVNECGRTQGTIGCDAPSYLLEVRRCLRRKVNRVHSGLLDRILLPNFPAHSIKERIIRQDALSLRNLRPRHRQPAVHPSFFERARDRLFIPAEKRLNVLHRTHHSDSTIFLGNHHRLALNSIQQRTERVSCIGGGKGFYLAAIAMMADPTRGARRPLLEPASPPPDPRSKRPPT